MARKIEVQIVGDARGLERAFGRASGAGTSFARSIRGAGVAVGAAFTGAIGAAGLFIKSAASFEESMQKVVGLSGVAQGEVNKLRGEVLKLSTDVGKGPQELAEGLLFITSSGVPASKAMEVLAASARAAAAGLGETKTVADAVTSVMNAYGPTVVNAGRATDVLVATVREGKGEAADFAGVIGNVVSIASQLGVSFEDVGAALAAQTRLGTDAATAATQLQQVFSNLVKVTPQAEKAFASVGLSTEGLRKTIQEKGLLAGLTAVKEAFGDNLPALARAFGDIRALRGVLGLVGTQAEQTAGIFDRMSDSTGSLDKAFGAVSKTTVQRFRQLKAAVQVSAIQIGSALAPLASIVAKGLTGAVTNLNEFIAKIGQARTVRAKFDVAFEGIQSLGRDLFDQARDALDGVDWNAVVAGAEQGFFTALRRIGEVINRINWNEVGRALGQAIADGFKATAAFLESVDWAEVGRTVVRGIGDFLKGVNWKAVAVATIKVLAAAFKAAASLLIGIGQELGGAIVNGIGRGLDEAKDAVLRKLLQFVNKVLGVTAFLGAFDPFKGVREKVQKQLRGMERDAKSAALSIEASLANIQDPTVRITIQTVIAGAANAASAVSGNAQAITGGVTDAIDGFRKAAQSALNKAGKSANETAETITNTTVAASNKVTKKALKKQFEKLIAGLELGVDRAELTRQLRDDVVALQTLKAGLEKQVNAGVDVIAAQTKLVQVTASIKEKQREIKQRAAGIGQVSQFRALGLGPEGDKLVPTVANLKKQLASLTSRLIDSKEMTPKIKGQLARVGKVLTGEFGKVTEETRAAVVSMFDAIRDVFDKQTEGPLTKTTAINTNKILEGLGLGRDAERELRARLARFNSAGLALAGGGGSTVRVGAFAGQPIEVTVVSQLDGQVVAKSVTKSQTKTGRGTRQKRGPNRRQGGV